MAWYDDRPPAPRRLVEGGITTRSRRGAIGETWWSRRFIDVLESLDLDGRLSRGRSYARSGQVLNLEVAAGSVAADVQGSRRRPYEVWIELRLIWPADWDRVFAVLASRAIYSAKLLAGEMPTDVESVFTELGLRLFPTQAGELTMECSCPDWAVPCKHIAATFYVLAEAFDRDPFLIFAWRGRSREQVLDELRRLRGAEPDAAGHAEPEVPMFTEPEPSLEDRIAEFWQPGGELPAAPVAVPDLVPDLVLRQLEPPPVRIDGDDLIDLLRPSYHTITRHYR